MKLNNKKGITVTSIVVYVILFFAFTTTITTISSRFNSSLFDDRGKAINVTAINKLEYNLLDSAKNSHNLVYSVNGQNVTLEFSNLDVYVFNLTDNVVYKNGGKLVKHLKAAEVTYQDNLINVDLTLNKYTNEVTRNIKISI